MFNRLIFSILSIVMVFSIRVPLAPTQVDERNKCRDWYLESDFPALYGTISSILSEQNLTVFQEKMGGGVSLISEYATTDADPCFIALRDRFVFIAFNTLLYKNLIAYGTERQLGIPPALIISIPQLLIITHEWEADMCAAVTFFCDDVNQPPADLDVAPTFVPPADLLREAR